MLRLLCTFLLLGASSRAEVFYNFDNLSHGGFIIDGEKDWSKGQVFSASDPAGIKAGKGALDVRLNLKPGKDVRVAKFYQTGDLSMLTSLSFQVKAAKPGLHVSFFAMTDGWKWSQLGEQELKPGAWTEVKAVLAEVKGLKPDKMNCLGLFFRAEQGYSGSVFVDEVMYATDGRPYPREAARAAKSPFAAVKSTQPVSVSVDGAKAHGVVKPGIISFNISGPLRGNDYASGLLKEAGPGVMRMWSFGGYKAQMNFNPAEGKYDWEYLDAEVKHLLSIGWQPMFCLGECQNWNMDPKRYVPKDFAKWARMAGDTVRHYNVDLKWGLKYWEIWNEHDIGFWGGTEEEYLQLLKLAAAEMKKADPGIRIFAGAWANPGLVKKLGGAMLDKVPPKGLYDGISWHNYLVSSILPEEKLMPLTPLMESPAYNGWKHLRERGLDSTMEVGMSEANINPSAETDWRWEGMLSGVYWASAMLHYILQNASLATFFQSDGDDNYGAITDKARPSFHSVLLFGKHAKVVGKQWLATVYDPSLANFETLALASDDEFSLLAVNKDLTGKAYAATYDLAGLPELESLQAWGIRDGQLEACPQGKAKLKKGKASYTFPPYSVTVLKGRFKSKRAPAPLTTAEPGAAALGMAVLGQYSFSGTPAVLAKAPAKVSLADPKSFAAAPPIAIQGKGYSAKVRLMKDAENFYVECEVEQGRGPVNQQPLSQLWNADSVEVGICSRADLAGKSRLKKSDWDYQLCLAPSSESGKPAIICYNAEFKGMQVESKPGATGYRLAASIPLSNFEELDWAPGKKVRFDVAVAKAGPDGKRESKQYWTATTDAWDSPDEWGLAEIQ